MFKFIKKFFKKKNNNYINEFEEQFYKELKATEKFFEKFNKERQFCNSIYKFRIGQKVIDTHRSSVQYATIIGATPAGGWIANSYNAIHHWCRLFNTTPETLSKEPIYILLFPKPVLRMHEKEFDSFIKENYDNFDLLTKEEKDKIRKENTIMVYYCPERVLKEYQECIPDYLPESI